MTALIGVFVQCLLTGDDVQVYRGVCVGVWSSRCSPFRSISSRSSQQDARCGLGSVTVPSDFKFRMHTGNKQGGRWLMVSLLFLIIYIYAFSRRFYPKRLTVHSGYTHFVSMCVYLGIEPTTLCAANAML